MKSLAPAETVLPKSARNRLATAERASARQDDGDVGRPEQPDLIVCAERLPGGPRHIGDSHLQDCAVVEPYLIDRNATQVADIADLAAHRIGGIVRRRSGVDANLFGSQRDGHLRSLGSPLGNIGSDPVPPPALVSDHRFAGAGLQYEAVDQINVAYEFRDPSRPWLLVDFGGRCGPDDAAPVHLGDPGSNRD